MSHPPCCPGPKVNTVENYFNVRENENKNLQHLLVSKHRKQAEWKYRKRETMGETNDVLFSKIPFIHSCSNGQNG